MRRGKINSFAMKFKDWLLIEMGISEIEARKPKHSEWSGDLFYFDVEGDDCSPKYCYFVYFEELSKRNAYEVEFSRLNNKSKDERRGVGNEVFNAVKYAILEFIRKKNPEYLTWSPVKTKVVNPMTGQVTNPEGRRDVYEGFAVRSLFPMYVSVRVNEWMRRDIYDRDYVSSGYPSIPDNMSSASLRERKEFLDKIRGGIVSHK